MKLLIVHNKSPEIHDLFTNQAKTICQELKKKIQLEITWVIFPSHDTINVRIQSPDVIDSRDYKDIFEMLKVNKPKFIIINGSLDFHNVNISTMAKYLKIPLIVLFLRNFQHVKSKSFFQSMRSKIRILTNYEITERNGIKTINSNDLRKFYLNQFKYMYKTLKKTKKNSISSIIFLIKYSKLVFFNSSINKIICGRINFCSNKEWKNKLIKEKFPKAKIFIIGDTYFDSIYNEIKNNENKLIKNHDKIKILFCTSTLHEHGMCTKNEEYDLIRNTIKNISYSEKFEISLKIHPSTSSKKEYNEQILKDITEKISVFQKEDLINLIKNHDIMLTYGGTGSIHYGVLMGMPIVNLDYNINATRNNVFVDDNLILQCKNQKVLIDCLERTKKKKITKKNIDDYVKKYIGIFDGNSSERAAQIIFDSIKHK